MQITIINDCLDQNAKLRQISRVGSLFENCSVNCFGVGGEMEASGSLVDAIDSFEGRKGIIIVNVAPRSKSAKKWKNGTPFGFFWHKETLIVSSVDGLVLSLVNKLNITDEFYILDIPDVLEAIEDKEMSPSEKQRITNSQFRSFEFLPRVARWLTKKVDIPCQKYDLKEVTDAPQAVWFVDNFGNIKTTLLKGDFDVDNNRTFKMKIGEQIEQLDFYDCLKDLPSGSIGLVRGSSGVGENRFIEIMMRGGNAAGKLGINIGDKVEIL